MTDTNRLDRRVRELERNQGGEILIASPVGGGGGAEFEEYETFPDIPDDPTVIWCKDIVWSAYPGDTYWRPMTQAFTTETGEPGT